MFAYCNNNPIYYYDVCGERIHPCFGLDLPDGCGVEITIDGETYLYYSTTNAHGELYEYWYDTDGNLIWVRHHSNHGNSKTHPYNPHDHTGDKDDKGNNTLGPETDVNPKFSAPSKNESQGNNTKETVAATAGLFAAGYVIYAVIKWGIAGALAPSAFGTSLVAAGATP